MGKVWQRGVWCVAASVTLGVTSVSAEMVSTSIGARILAAGGHCDKPPDEIVPSESATDGHYERHDGDYVFAVEGDRFPARTGLGVGVRVVLPGYGPGSLVTVRTWNAKDGPSSWEVRVDPDGQVEFGTLPFDGEALLPGRYLLSVLSDGQELMTFAFIVEAELDDGLCLPAVS